MSRDNMPLSTTCWGAVVENGHCLLALLQVFWIHLFGCCGKLNADLDGLIQQDLFLYTIIIPSAGPEQYCPVASMFTSFLFLPLPCLDTQLNGGKPWQTEFAATSPGDQASQRSFLGGTPFLCQSHYPNITSRTRTPNNPLYVSYGEPDRLKAKGLIKVQ